MKRLENPIHVLSAVHWQEGGATHDEWVRLGIAHGFTGVGEDTPQAHHVRQVHGTDIVEANVATVPDDLDARTVADGVFTLSSREKVGVKTADCLPALFHGQGMVMAVHAGWRGLVGGILEAAVDTFASHGIGASSLRVALGPCIGFGSFEVGPEVVERLVHGPNHPESERLGYCLAKGARDRWFVDLTAAAVFKLAQVGIDPTNIAAMRACTLTSPLVWHSYRRNGKGAGRNWSWIAL